MKRKKYDNLIYGKHPIVDVINSGITVDKILADEEMRGAYEVQLRALCRTHLIPLKKVPKSKLDKLAPQKNHQGIIAFTAPISYYRLEQVLPTIFEKGETPLIVLLDGVTDVRNFGAIARTAEGAGVHTIVVSHKKSAAINDIALKSSAGALASIPVCREPSILAAATFLQQCGVQLLASKLNADIPVRDLDFSIPTAIIVGAEDRGVSRELVQLSDVAFSIPMKGTVDSYNVAVATGMILYEAIRNS